MNHHLIHATLSLLYITTAPPITYENPKAKTKAVRVDADDLFATTYSIDKAPLLDDFISLICEPKNEVRYLFMKKPFGSSTKEVVLCTANTDRDNGFECKVSRKALISLISLGVGINVAALDTYSVRLDNAFPFYRGVLLEFVADKARCFVYCPFDDLPKNRDSGWPMDISRWQLVSGNNAKSLTTTLATSNEIAVEANFEKDLSSPINVLDPRRNVDSDSQPLVLPADAPKPSDPLSEKLSGATNQNKRSLLAWNSEWFENNLDTDRRYQVRQLVAPGQDWVGRVSQIPNEPNWRIEWFHRRNKKFVLAATTSSDGAVHFTQSVDAPPVTSFLDIRTGLPVVQYSYNQTIYSVSMTLNGSTYVSESNVDYIGEKADGNIVDFRSNFTNSNGPNALGALLVIHQKAIVVKIGANPGRNVLWPDRRAIANNDTAVAANFVDSGRKLVLLTYSLVDKAKVHVFDLTKNRSGRL